MNRSARTLLALTLVGAMAACAPAADEESASPQPMASGPSIGATSMEPMPAASVAPGPSGNAVASHDMDGMGGAETMTVHIENFAFVEDRIEVSVGDTVTWSNGDGTRHTITSGTDDTGDGTFDSGDVAAGETFSLTFTEAGEFPYFCDIHPTMTGVVVVAP